jgi:hypothetical protein
MVCAALDEKPGLAVEIGVDAPPRVQPFGPATRPKDFHLPDRRSPVHEFRGVPDEPPHALERCIDNYFVFAL